MIFGNSTGPTAATGSQFPDVKTTLQCVEASAKYKFDDDIVRALGWKGTVTAKLHYAWERPSVTNWQIDGLDAYSYAPTLTGVGYMTWLAPDNPNYNVHLLAASVAFKW